MRRSISLAVVMTLIGGGAIHAATKPVAAPRAALAAAVASPGRSEANRARDKYRHPAETLAFFGVKPTDTVVELIPGGGWYTEILVPYLANGGKLYAAQAPGKGSDALKAKFAGAKVTVVPFPGTGVAPNSADVVLTFRNLHNLTMKEDGTDTSVLKEVYAILKPGGIFGVEEHRLPEGRDAAAEKTSGYLKVSSVRRIVESAGFDYVGASEVNANPKDKADYPKGVWTLPPTFTEGDKDRAKYAAIGESDRMTLKFRKPLK